MALNGRFNGIRIEPTSNNGREAIKKYCMKEDSRVKGPWSDSKIYTGKDLPQTLWAWQETVKGLCMQEPDDRHINYIYDPIGGKGKSKFCKYMGYHHKALVLPWGRTGDIQNLVIKKGARSIYLFDLSRSKPQDWAQDDVSAAMEGIKNGHIVNYKFETDDFYMDPPHIWCFSNQLPNFSSMSRDRWILWEIDDLSRLVRISSGRLRELMSQQQRERRRRRSRSRSPARRARSRSPSVEIISSYSQGISD